MFQETPTRRSWSLCRHWLRLGLFTRRPVSRYITFTTVRHMHHSSSQFVIPPRVTFCPIGRPCGNTVYTIKNTTLGSPRDVPRNPYQTVLVTVSSLASARDVYASRFITFTTVHHSSSYSPQFVIRPRVTFCPLGRPCGNTVYTMKNTTLGSPGDVSRIHFCINF